MDPSESRARLITAMKTLAKRRTPHYRKAVYRALLSTSLIVPTQRESADSPAFTYAQDEPLNGRPVYVAFTSTQALERWRPEDLNHVEVEGAELFTVLAGSDAASVLINPKGDIGGELYSHEIVMLAEAAPRLRAWNAARKAD